MKLRLLILLAAALAAAPAAGQTIKSLGYNTTNGNIVAATNVTFTNSVGFATNARATTRTNLGGTTVGNAVFTATNAAAAATAVGLGAANSVTFASAFIGTATDQLEIISEEQDLLTVSYRTNGTVASFISFNPSQITFGGPIRFNTTNQVATTRTNLGLGATNNVTFSNITATGTLGVSNAATFATNVTVNGNLSVGSLTTTTPSTWALDATQTAADTNGILALPSNANVIRLTNNTAISGVSGGVLGAFYYLVNQTTNAVTISNVGGITVQGGTPLTLGANQAATLVATGATNASVAARGDLTDVTLGGTANTAPSQTASSGSSLMTRDLLFRAQADDNSGDLVAMVGNTTNGGTGAIANARDVFGANAQVSTNSNSVAGVYFADNIWGNSTITGAVIPSGKTIDLTMKGVNFRNLTNTSYVIRVVAGVGAPTRTIPAAGQDALSARGWGVNFFYNGTNHVFQPFWYTTSYNTGPQTVVSNAEAGNSIFALRLRHEGPTTNGTISFWINDGLASRLSETPSFSTNVGDWNGNFGGRHYAIESATATNAAPAATTGIRVRAAYIKYDP